MSAGKDGCKGVVRVSCPEALWSILGWGSCFEGKLSAGPPTCVEVGRCHLQGCQDMGRSLGHFDQAQRDSCVRCRGELESSKGTQVCESVLVT